MFGEKTRPELRKELASLPAQRMSKQVIASVGEPGFAACRTSSSRHLHLMEGASAAPLTRMAMRARTLLRAAPPAAGWRQTRREPR